ncbi:hypothetical protein E4U31_003926 [Claviceps sp. LM219 group G6]|nr:hypothetical protein E4U31_003926 [Claviceps sp. LM219 group G6]
MAPENRILCLCTAADIQFGDAAWSDEQSKDIRHWPQAISSPIEVLAGQHRIAALRDYVTETESDPAELWWTCELYDRDTLPMHLNQSMRYNRTDSAMPDSHAQVWMQLVAIISRQQDEKVSDGDAVNSDQDPLVNVGDPVLDALRLATARSSSRLGSFLRIDEYYLGLMESVLNTLRSLPLDMATHISPSDWDQLAAAFGTRGGDQTSDALSIFYDASGAKSRTLAQASDPHIFAGRTAQFGAKQGFLEFCYKQAVYIQNTILDFAREQTTKFDSCPIRLTFLTGDSAPRLTTSDYTTRFAYGAWTQLLNLTRDQLAIAIGVMD